MSYKSVLPAVQKKRSYVRLHDENVCKSTVLTDSLEVCC